MKILGVDPGLGIVGFGMVVFASYGGAVRDANWGVVTTSKHKSDSERLQEIYEDMTRVVQSLSPDIAVVERLFFFRNATTMVPVSQARGVILLVLQLAGIPLYEYTPMQVKLAVTGYGKSKKPEVQHMVAQLLNLSDIPRPDDAADALALALCHHHHHIPLPDHDGRAALPALSSMP